MKHTVDESHVPSTSRMCTSKPQRLTGVPAKQVSPPMHSVGAPEGQLLAHRLTASIQDDPQ